MRTIENSLMILQKIKEKKISFVRAVNKDIPHLNLDSGEIAIVKSNIKHVINRYYYLRWQIKHSIRELSDENLDLLIVALAQVSYSRGVSFDEAIEELKRIFEETGVELDFDTVTNVLQTLKDAPLSINDNYPTEYIKRTSLKNSIPEWIVKMVTKQYGISNAIKSFQAMRRIGQIGVSVNTMLTSVEKIAENLDFEKSKLCDSCLNYKGKTRLIDLPAFQKCEIFIQDELQQFLIDTIDPEQGDEILIVNKERTMMSVATAIKINDLGKVYHSVLEYGDAIAVANLAKKFNLRSIDPFEGDSNLMITHLAPNSLDKVLVIAPSSELGLIRKKPEVPLTLKRDALDGIILKAMAYLKDSAEFVKEGGILLYATYTINRKESTTLVSTFLSEHPEFVLEEEKQIFPYELNTDGLYYAILKKKAPSDEEDEQSE